MEIELRSNFRREGVVVSPSPSETGFPGPLGGQKLLSLAQLFYRHVGTSDSHKLLIVFSNQVVCKYIRTVGPFALLREKRKSQPLGLLISNSQTRTVGEERED